MKRFVEISVSVCKGEANTGVRCVQVYRVEDALCQCVKVKLIQVYGVYRCTVWRMLCVSV